MDRYKYKSKPDNFAYTYNLTSEISLKSDKIKPKKRYKHLFNKKKKQMKSTQSLELDKSGEQKPKNDLNSSTIKIDQNKRHKILNVNCCRVS